MPIDEGPVVEAYAPGRVNLIGDHTDYTGGLVLPMAVDRGTTVRVEHDPASRELQLTSADAAGVAVVRLDEGWPDIVGGAAATGWARVVRAVASLVPPAAGGRGRVTTTLPVGAGLSSSSALSVSLALAFGLSTAGAGGLAGAAALCREAEELATGVPCGIMDQLTSLAGRAGHSLLVDCGAVAWDEIPVPEEAQVVVVHSGEPRTLAGSGYARRRAECEAAAAIVGPLAAATPDDLAGLADPTLRRRARHVVSENGRVRAAAAALRNGDLDAAGALMIESHRSLAEDFEVSTPALDQLVEALRRVPGVVGARLTGAGFGGCAVALARREQLRAASLPSRHWLVEATDGARRTIAGG